VDGAFVVNPTFEQLEASDMDIVVAGTATDIVMVEGGTREVSEADLLAALDFGMEHVRRLVSRIQELVSLPASPSARCCRRRT